MALETKLPSVNAAGTGTELLVAGLALFSERPAELARFYEQVLRTAFTHRVHDDGKEHWITALGGVQLEIKALSTADGAPTTDGAATLVGEVSNEPSLHVNIGSTLPSSGVSRSELSFRVHGVAPTVARALVAGGRVVQRAETFSWGTFAVVLDPDSNRLGLFEPPAPNSTTESEEA